MAVVSCGNPDIQHKQFLSDKYTCACRMHTYTTCTYGCSQDIVTSLTHVQFTFACLRRTQFSPPLSIPSFPPLSCRFLHPSSSSVITQTSCSVPLLQNVFFCLCVACYLVRTWQPCRKAVLPSNLLCFYPIIHPAAREMRPKCKQR